MSAPESNWMRRTAEGVDAAIAPVCRLLTVIGAGCLAVMGVLTVMDVAGRYLFNRPIPGTLELSEFALVLLVFLALGSTGLRGSQVVVDIALDQFSPRLRAISDVFNALLAIYCGWWHIGHPHPAQCHVPHLRVPH